MGASNFSGQFNKDPDYLDGASKETRDSKTAGQPDLYTLLKELARGHRSFLKAAADGAAATATAETPFAVFDGYAKSIRAAQYVPAAALTANDATYATLIVRARKADGTLIGIVAQATTKTAGSGGTGNWTQNVPVTIPLSDGTNPLALDSAKLDVSAGGFLTFEITKASTGVVVPAGVLNVTPV